MAGSVTRSDFAALMGPAAAIKVLYDDYTGTNVPLQQFRKIFNIESSDGAYETELGTVGIGQPALKRELEQVRFDKPKQGRPVTYINNTFALGVSISKEAVDDDRSKKLAQMMGPELGRVFKIEMEIQAAAIFGNAFTFQGYEPEKTPPTPLVSTNHRLIRPSALGASNSNQVQAALSYTALSTARQLGRRNLTESGKRDPIIYKYLVVAPGNQTLAETLVRSTLVPGQFTGGTQPNDVNVLGPQLEVVVLDYIPDDGRWFMLTEKGMHKLKWFDREMPTSDTDYDKKIRAMLFLTFARWALGFSDYRGVLGSSGS